jgi:hypothetical protein
VFPSYPYNIAPWSIEVNPNPVRRMSRLLVQVLPSAIHKNLALLKSRKLRFNLVKLTLGCMLAAPLPVLAHKLDKFYSAKKRFIRGI